MRWIGRQWRGRVVMRRQGLRGERRLSELGSLYETKLRNRSRGGGWDRRPSRLTDDHAPRLEERLAVYR